MKTMPNYTFKKLVTPKGALWLVFADHKKVVQFDRKFKAMRYVERKTKDDISKKPRSQPKPFGH